MGSEPSNDSIPSSLYGSLQQTMHPSIAQGVTSERHTLILNTYKEGAFEFFEWVKDRLGGIHLKDWSWGHAAFHWDIDDRYVIRDDFVFGGHVASIGDHVLATTAMTVLADSKDRFKTSRLETQFFRPVRKPSVQINARVINLSRSMINVEADYINDEGKLAVRVSATQSRTYAGPL
ncbi:MAG: PaaI family thioesterase [Pseudomonadota bacterium]